MTTQTYTELTRKNCTWSYEDSGKLLAKHEEITGVCFSQTHPEKMLLCGAPSFASVAEILGHEEFELKSFDSPELPKSVSGWLDL